jgi:hypothetical protein
VDGADPRSLMRGGNIPINVRRESKSLKHEFDSADVIDKDVFVT